MAEQLHKKASHDYASWKHNASSLPGSTNNATAGESSPFNITIPSISLPKGGGTIKGIDEQFQVNAINGSASFSIPLPVSAARGFAPTLSLAYNSGNGNGLFGLGWSLSLASIKRKTDSKLPQYKDALDSDTYVFSGGEDLVPRLKPENDEWLIDEVQSPNDEFTIKQYRPRIESAFARIERWTNNNDSIIHWRVTTKDNITSILGDTPGCRIADPNDPGKIFEWLLHISYDDKGNCVVYEYKTEDGEGINPLLVHNKNRTTPKAFVNTLLKRVRSGNKTPYANGAAIPAAGDFMFETCFDYGEHDPLNAPFNEIQPWPFRTDAFSDYRAGFEIRTARLCKRVLLYHHFTELPGGSACVRSLDLTYDNNGQQGNFTFLRTATSTGYTKHDNGAYTQQSLPPMSFSYQQQEWSFEIKTATGSVTDSPAGLFDPNYQWVDLFNEGLSGILSQQAGSLFYKHNLGEGKFSPAKLLTSHPAAAGMGNELQLQELEGDGAKYFTGLHGLNKGFYKITDNNEWQPFQSFEQLPNIDLNDANTRLLDLNGDGKAELLITDDNVFTWYPSLGEKGYDTSRKVWQGLDEEKGPYIVFNDAEQSIFLADMNGDGLTDIVRIKNGAVCYWPNLGYGKFGAKVTMDNAPLFDQPDLFNTSFIKLADIDGSGTTDLIYLGNQQCIIWLNQHGNNFLREPVTINTLPAATPLSQITILDFLGNGSSCIVWSSIQPKDREQPLRYIDLMSSKKPHLMVGYKNNLGKEVELVYKPSTYYYLQDQLQGTPWVTKLPFPVHCLSKVVTRDRIQKTRFASEYSYHHGYYDHGEREFRGFGRVEQQDAEEITHFIKESAATANGVVEQHLHQPPVLTKSWFHTGAFPDNEKILTQFAHEYAPNNTHPENKLPEPALPANLTMEECRQALRACKGRLLRREIFALDNTELQARPYTVEQLNAGITFLQPQLENNSACFMVTDSETITYNYERNESDPRVTHAFVLETDKYANVLKSASVVYPRHPIQGEPPHAVEQKARYATCRENDFTVAVATIEAYRSPVLYQTKLFELTGLPTPAGDYYTLAEIRSACAAAAFIDFEVPPNGAQQKRLVNWSRQQFKSNDGSSILNFGIMESKALVHRSFIAAYNANLLNNAFSQKIAAADLHTLLTDVTKGGYVFADNYYWIPSALPQYDLAHFHLPVAYTDAFNNTTTIEYDATCHLFANKTTDALGNTIRINNFNYRVLQPYVLQDANDNVTAVRFNELGYVTGNFIIGKKGIDAGDELNDTSIEPSANDFPSAALEYHFNEWYHQTNQPGFDINNYKPQPNFIKTTTRETHYHAHPAHATKLQVQYAYFEGSGNEVLKKTQAEPGEALQVNLDGTVTTINTTPNVRYTGNGRIIRNNKGNTVKQYEPYFSVTPGFDDEKEMAELGVTAIQHYDPLNRVIRTDYPNKTFSKVAFTPWLQQSFDANDTVAQSDWYKLRITTPDPDIATPEEVSAAQKAFAHNNTPAISHFDTLGRPFKMEANTGAQQLITHIQFDIEGKEIKVTDALDRQLMRYDYDLQGRCLKRVSLDAGTRLMITDAGNNEILRWDERDHEFSFTFDALRRLVQSTVKTGNADAITYSKIEYGESLTPAIAKSNNLRGVAYKIYDQSGLNTVLKNDFKGNLLSGSRQLAANYANSIDWKITSAVELDAAVYTVMMEYDALERAVKVITPHSPAMTPSEIFPGYNEAGLLNTIDVKIRSAVTATPFVTNINYNAKGSRDSIFYGNNTKTKYTYDPATFRLTEILTTRNNGNILQHLQYTYDPMGNITRLKDHAQADVFFDNEQVQALNNYEYDAIYRLITALGRKHAGQTDIQPKATLGGNNSFRNHPFMNSGSINPNDANAFRNYTETYTYDKAGNLLQLQHIAKNSSFTRTFEYDNNDNNNNRLTKTSINGDDYNYTYDAHGNMYGLETINNEVWDFSDQLKQADLTGGGTVYYVYDANGERVRKVTERPNGAIQERIYLDGIEIYREKNSGGTITLERETLHVMDEQQRIALIDTPVIKPVGNNETELVRYQYSNHLNSSSFELDDAAQVISYEEYFPFGTTSFATIDSTREVAAKRYRYSGKERDEESGLNYHGARYYAPWLCRWTAVEPLLITPGESPIGKLAYGYCSNNPANRIDPDGKLDYLNTEGAKIGSDGNKDDNVLTLLDKNDIKKIERKYKGSFWRRAANVSLYPAIGAAVGAILGAVLGKNAGSALLLALLGAVIGVGARLANPNEIFYAKKGTALTEIKGQRLERPEVVVRQAIQHSIDQSKLPTNNRVPPANVNPNFIPDHAGGFHEEGGFWGRTPGPQSRTVVLHAYPGNAGDPAFVSGLSIDTSQFIAGTNPPEGVDVIEGTWHIHPDGTTPVDEQGNPIRSRNATTQLGSTMGTTRSVPFVMPPSLTDINNVPPNRQYHIVVGVGDNTVYFYNSTNTEQNRYIAKMPLNVFMKGTPTSTP